LRVI